MKKLSEEYEYAKKHGLPSELGRTKAMSKNKCVECGQPVGNDVFTVCDDCWSKQEMSKKEKLSENARQFLEVNGWPNPNNNFENGVIETMAEFAKQEQEAELQSLEAKANEYDKFLEHTDHMTHRDTWKKLEVFEQNPRLCHLCYDIIPEDEPMHDLREQIEKLKEFLRGPVMITTSADGGVLNCYNQLQLKNLIKELKP